MTRCRQFTAFIGLPSSIVREQALETIPCCGDPMLLCDAHGRHLTERGLPFYTYDVCHSDLELAFRDLMCEAGLTATWQPSHHFLPVLGQQYFEERPGPCPFACG